MANSHICVSNSFFSYRLLSLSWSFFFFFNDTATTEIYTLSLHDALPILTLPSVLAFHNVPGGTAPARVQQAISEARIKDRKSTRLNSSHVRISYAVFCLKKKKTKRIPKISIPRRTRIYSKYLRISNMSVN